MPSRTRASRQSTRRAFFAPCWVATGGMFATLVSSGWARSAVYAKTSRPWRDIQATAQRVSSPPEKAMPIRVPFGGSVRWIRLMVPVRYTENRGAARGGRATLPIDRKSEGCPALFEGPGPNRAGVATADTLQARPMSGIARTSATGAGGMLPELLAWSSSFRDDRALVREDLIGSAAHVTMLARTGIVSPADARSLRDALRALYNEACAGTLALPSDEEDVHMAVEAELGKRVGAVAARLHTARSRNDQVALDLRLHVRDQGVALVRELSALVAALADRAAREKDVLLPAYTHRQRAQPVSAGFLVAAWGIGLVRATQTVIFGLDQIEMPLGSGACSGTSLPIDRALVARLFAPWEPTRNALQTVGDRDFALDWTWGVARVVLALGRLATDVVDFSTSEFGLVRRDGAISAGSSMMPQKKNPAIFELVRGKSTRAVGNVVAMLALMKGLASGYNRD